ncbi:L-rhamnonate dehydratase [Diplonema papillatum]|nr:L-rhamnonate dehydratase [Diplonema papillatum]|eukprot:gene15877-24261_t
MSVSYRPHLPVVPEADAVVVKEVRAYVMDSKAEEEQAGGGADCHAQAKGHWIVDTPISNPMSVYPLYKESRKQWGIDAIGSMIVIVELTNGMTGVGIAIAGEPGCYIVENHLSRFVEGQDPRNIELIWDQMFRSTINYGRKGLTIQAISALDLALWDVLGKLKNEPVYNLLGGKTKDKLPVYATTVRPDYAKEAGFVQAKVPLPYGPGDGDEGMDMNIEYLKEIRAKIGNFPLALDCYMSLTVPYTIELARRIKEEVPHGIKWIEEHLPPDDYEGYAEVRAKAGHWNLFTCGEHEYTRYGFRQLLEKKCIDVLQPDITWCGGMTEARKVCAMAQAYDIPVIPHGSSVYSYHLQIAYSNCPITEFIMLSPTADSVQPYFGSLFLDEPLPEKGYITLDPKKPGFGVTLNPDAKLRRPYPRDPSKLRTRDSLAADAAACVSNSEWTKRAAQRIVPTLKKVA